MSAGKRIAIALFSGVASYVAGAFLGGGLIHLVSSNPHDRSLEAAMTGAFVFGPMAAVIGFAAALLLSRPRPGAVRATGPDLPA